MIKRIRQFLCRHKWQGRLTINNQYHEVRWCVKCGKFETVWSGTLREWRDRHGA